MVTQQFTSASTSRKQVPALHKHYGLFEGLSVLDYGGGKYDLGVNFLREKGFRAEVYDPFNRSQAHNERVLAARYTSVLLSNVLNVIKEKEIRLQVVAHALSLGKKVFITVYCDKNKCEGMTKDGYQMHKPLPFYVSEIKEYFPDVSCVMAASKIIVLG